MIGRVIAHYRITAAIGAGGMGQVYRATNAKLNRDVALKVLPIEMGSSSERLDRFQREAKALAALDHPGIVTVYSVEEFDGAYWNAGRYEEGLSVSRRLIALLPDYYFEYIWGALNAVGLAKIEEAREMIRQAEQVQPALLLSQLRKSLGAMSPDVDRRMSATLREAGVAEN
jgi:serine/threonine protein kinase